MGHPDTLLKKGPGYFASGCKVRRYIVTEETYVVSVQLWNPLSLSPQTHVEEDHTRHDEDRSPNPKRKTPVGFHPFSTIHDTASAMRKSAGK